MKKITFPSSKRDDTVDNYHGTMVPDPYRWLEDADSGETAAWTGEQKTLTESFLSRDSYRDPLKERLKGLWNYPKYSVPEKAGDCLFFFKNDGLQNQPVLYMQKTLESAPEVLLDPNDLSDDGTIAVNRVDFSHDGTLMTYAVSVAGSDWHEIKVRRIEQRQDYPETLKWSLGGIVAWKHDNSGFFYSRFPEPGTVPEGDSHKHNRLYWHKLGTQQSEDRLVYERPDYKELTFYPIVTDDGAYLVLHIFWASGPKNRVYYRKIESEGEFVRLIDDDDGHYDLIDNRGPLFYFNTDTGAPKGRIIAIDVDHPGRESWREIVPEQEDALSSTVSVGGLFVCTYLHHARHVLKVYDFDGAFKRGIPLRGMGSIGSLSAKSGENELFFSFTSFLSPSQIFRYDTASEELTLFRKSELQFDPAPYRTVQVFYTSRDGTRVPMFITHKKGLALNGKNPAILYGYGGFSLDMTPFFSLSNLLWLEQGGIHAVANLRGGSEYGEEWHEAGMKEKKQNVFDDFISAALWLIDSRYTSASRLAINGGSNGGLLVAACLVQRPDLFGAAVCEIPLIDMLRYHRFTLAHYWIREYGDAEHNADDFASIYAYSPLHNIRDGAAYPPTPVVTADHDDRVVSCHARKFVAALQHAQEGSAPILLRLETRAGHGQGKPTSKAINERSDVLAFLFKAFGMKFTAEKYAP